MGASYTVTGGVFLWSTSGLKLPHNATWWSVGQPSANSNEDCVAVAMSQRLTHYDCGRRNAFLCQHESKQQLTVMDPCYPLNDATYFNGKCMKTINTSLPWEAARSWCESLQPGGRLLEMFTEEERVESGLYGAQYEKLWTGGHDPLCNKTFVWSRSPAVVIDNNTWINNEPNNAYSREDCSCLVPSGLLNDVTCGNIIFSICQNLNGTTTDPGTIVQNISVNGRSFQLIKILQNFTQAQMFCESRNGTLAELLTSSDMSVIASNFIVNTEYRMNPCDSIFPGSIYISGQCFKYYNSQVTWQEANLFCLLNDSHLAEPHTSETQRKLVYYIRHELSAWLGANDVKVNRAFRWTLSTLSVSSQFLQLSDTTGHDDYILWYNTPDNVSWVDWPGEEKHGFLCQKAAVAPNPQRHVAVLPKLSNSGSMRSYVQVTTSYSRYVMYVTFREVYDVGIENVTPVPLVPPTGITFTLSGRLMLPATESGEMSRGPDFRLSRGLSRGPDIRLSRGLSREPDFRLSRGLSREPDFRLSRGLSREPDFRLSRGLSRRIGRFNRESNIINTSRISLGEVVNLNLRANLDGAYVYTTQPTSVYLGSVGKETGGIFYDSTFDEVLPLKFIGSEYFTFPASAPNFANTCLTTLLPSTAWRNRYDMMVPPSNYVTQLCIIVETNLTQYIHSSQISVSLVCQRIEGTIFSGCTQILPTNITDLHIQLTDQQKSFGAYMVSVAQSSAFCHPVGVAGNVILGHFTTFQHQEYLQYLLKPQQPDACVDDVTTYGPSPTHELTTELDLTSEATSDTTTSDTTTDLPTEVTTYTTLSVDDISTDVTTPTVHPSTSVDATDTTLSVSVSTVTEDIKVISKEKIASIKRTLYVDPHNISAFRRTKLSAQDRRFSSSIIGGSGIALLIVPFVIVILSDLTYFLRSCGEKTQAWVAQIMKTDVVSKVT
ncbi:hypothetical protein Btru_063025 [Bulinus truncatus]|nr:hypothetical protein Btru_063025 [Bulinus truncatus]